MTLTQNSSQALIRTCYESLNQALKRIHKNKPELLLVLDRPDVPLHNNASETYIREYVTKRKISGSTRSRDILCELEEDLPKAGHRFLALSRRQGVREEPHF
ncbi:MAG: IS66 family transposase [Desulfomonilaceae bacterium]